MTGRVRRPRVLDGIARLGTIIGVWAHPGEEAFLSSGLMALAREAGNRVVVVTATRGERHTGDPARWPAHRLAKLRSDELAASLAVLDVVEHRWLGFADYGCSDVPAAVAIERLWSLIVDVDPRTVITLGPHGITGDHDHRAVSAWTAAVCRTLKRPPLQLHASPSSEAAPRARSGLSMGAKPLRLRVDGALLERKAAALRAHASQVCGIRHDNGSPRIAARWQAEMFVTADSGDSTAEVSPPRQAGAETPPSAARGGIGPRPCSCLSEFGLELGPTR